MGRPVKGSVRWVNGKALARIRGEHLGTFDTEEEAWAVVHLALERLSGNEPDTLKVFGTKWLDARELGGDIRGIDQERSVWRQHIASAKFYEWPMKRVRAADVQQWLNALAQKKKLITRRKRDGVKTEKSEKRISRQTVVHARRVLYACFRAALIERKVSSNPVEVVITPKMATVVEDSEHWTFLSLPEIDRLFAAIELADRRDFYRAWYATAIFAGLRLEEIKGLMWQDIRNGEILVRRSSRGPLKQRSSRRTVPMLRPLRDALFTWQRHGGAVRMRGLVFPSDYAERNAVKTRRGSHFSDGYDGLWEVQWRAKSGCRPSVRFHDLRHSCASHLIMGSWGRAFSLLEVKAWLGHSDIATTQRYSHLAPGTLAERVREMESFRESKVKAKTYGHPNGVDSENDPE